MHASQHWRWLYDSEQKQLIVELDHGLVHKCPYKASRLIPLQPMQAAFTTDDASCFQEFYDILSAYELWDPMLLTQAAINRTILEHFGRPQMPQSWYFQSCEVPPNYSLDTGALVELNSGTEKGIFAIMNGDDEFAECMLLSPSMALSDVKTLQQYDSVKVLRNRLQPSHYLQLQLDDDHLRHA
ncbi:Cell division protein ZapC [Pseudidiomarina piscicola]|uniref:Cell division protein ZapC n=1 Tax=Pseudidiomarina piscicola TaxID=2614830 RepID=A0A6S6WJK5_9GAMM|nr:cell division protein ZapC domain-containing protein [Pseudidiomarina piscicola]CAB0149968.1 Cell division protein ZapC [Pseudidiomarina piscicola]VZT39414.1 Cell division protein ZapC [Pseudomonas aeruginosa]